MICWQLFLAFLQIGAFSFGGGYAAIPLIQAQVIDKYGWLTQADFADLVTIAEMTPGPVAVNAATFVGNLTAGIPGAVCATLGVILPSCIFVTVLAFLYVKYRNLKLMQGILKSLRPAVVAMILAAGLKILLPALFIEGTGNASFANISWLTLLLFAGALAVLRKWKASPIKVMLACGIISLAVESIKLWVS
ncbi:MAG: chromate transporter [Lachnospiraceae bacterium]|nr:chromate transporter [Lachnospiraceae bacterium]